MLLHAVSIIFKECCHISDFPVVLSLSMKMNGAAYVTLEQIEYSTCCSLNAVIYTRFHHTATAQQ